MPRSEKTVIQLIHPEGNGITTGSDTTHFNPTTSCNRAQVVTFLYRAFVG